jgi:branched-chain amino acid transport system permease protein
MDPVGLLFYLVAFLIAGGIYAILCLALNVQWGYGGLFNAGIAGFFAVGAYTSALLTAAPAQTHLGGFQNLHQAQERLSRHGLDRHCRDPAHGDRQ